jgi:hypothetical protein
MISQKNASFLFLFICFSAIFVFFAFFRTEYRYDYAHYEKKIKSSFNGVWNYTLTWKIDLTGVSRSVIVAFDKHTAQNSWDTTLVRWFLDGKTYVRTLDREDTDTTERVFTFPFVTDRTWELTYSISSGIGWDVTLIITDIEKTPYLAFQNPFQSVEAADGSLSIIRRSEWWANESLRYWSDAELEKSKKEWEERWKTPFIIEDTDAAKHERELEAKRSESIQEIRWDAAKVVSLQRYEWGKKLLWPIKKTKSVDRIVIHHTAENLEQDADDATLLRAIYAYHARTRGWWDIWYNYIIGQRGEIYEWRAGWDFVEWAHAFANNLGSVGISVIGNFETMKLNRDQRKWLESAIVYFAHKYGIDILEPTTWVRTCKMWWDCLFDEQTIYRLHGHRDVGYTSCPWVNLYSLLSEMRTTLSSRIGAVISTKNSLGIIDPLPEEDKVQYVSRTVSVPPQKSLVITSPIKKTQWWKLLKIKLSYPHENEIVLEGPLYKNPDIRIWKRKVISKKWESMKIHTWKNNTLITEIGWKKYTSPTMSFASDIVRISSWSRIPSWDTNKQYNDNTFRGKIIIHNIDGKLLIVNELPIEDYLKWLGEVSNSDLEEKIKTIIVSARTYAQFYRDPKNRKYNTMLYDWLDDPDSFQRYLGYGYEERSPRVALLVEQTRGEVVTYNGSLVKTWYFSSSDGRTLSHEEYCKNTWSMNCKNIPYLQSVTDPGWIGKTRSGHGVGISGIWATHFASEWWKYTDIIKYYMKGVEIQKK